MKIENFKEKGLFEHRLNFPLPEETFNYYTSKDLRFFVKPSIWELGKWVIIPSSPKVAMEIKLERFVGDEQRVLEKLKEWT